MNFLSQHIVSPVVIKFLKELSKNNNREWFADNKPFYLEAKAAFEEATAEMIDEISKIDNNVAGLHPKDCVFRIYRDVRFSKDKTPYKTHFDAFIATKGGRKSLHAGYYMHVMPGKSLLGGGVYAPIPEILNYIRREIYNFPNEFRAIILNPEFKMLFGTLYEAKLKNVPRGFPKDFEYADLLKYKSYIVAHSISDRELMSPMMKEKFKILIKVLLPFNAFINRGIDFKDEIIDF